MAEDDGYPDTVPKNFNEGKDGPSLRKKEVVGRLAGKQSKNDVNYRPKKSDDKESCIECEFYIHPDEDSSTCKKVAGMVYAEDTCDEFTERKYDGQGSSALADEVQSKFEVRINFGPGTART